MIARRGPRTTRWPVDGEGPRPAPRLSTHGATAGLVGVLLVLAAFSVTAAIRNASAATQAQLSAAVSQWSEQAERSLAAEEDLGDELAAAPEDQGLLAEYDDARAATRSALLQLGAVEGTGHDVLVEGWLELHDRYGVAVAELIATARRDPESAEAFEETDVDPYFEAVEDVVQLEAADHVDDANQALQALGRSQQLLLWATLGLFGAGLGLVGWFTSVLTRSRRETMAQAERNRQQSLHDSLTGLPNRVLLRQRARTALDQGGTTALVLIDLDRFKDINDTLGHAQGDLVLQAVAARLQGALRVTDTVARLGGDEFAILLPAVGDQSTALELAERAQAALDARIEIDGLSLDVDASMGIALSGAHAPDVETLLQNADIAMYAAKDRSLGVCVYGPQLNDHSPERLGLLGELRRAIDDGELVLHYQPKLGLADGQVHGVEALVRWEHPERGLVMPGSFVPLAERTPLIRALTRYVLDAALEQCAAWHAAGRDLHVAVNVSARNLLDERFVDDVLEALALRRFPAARLELEVTESAIMADPDRALRILTRLAAEGITLSIDDFGAGYTSLAHLKDLPVHQLKIDRSFVTRMSADRRDALVVRSVIELGHNLGLTTVAEGVEDQQTWDQLAELGCDVGQGYHLCRPLPVEQLEAWFDRAGAVLPV